MDKRRQNSLRYLPDFTQQYSVISFNLYGVTSFPLLAVVGGDGGFIPHSPKIYQLDHIYG